MTKQEAKTLEAIERQCKAANCGCVPAKLTDDQIRDIAINYGMFMTVGEYDITKYDCEEDFFNCVRAAIDCAFHNAPAAPTEGARDAEDSLHWIMRFAQDIKEPCGEDPESPAAIRNAKLAVIAQVAAQGLGIVGGPSLVARDSGVGTAVAYIEHHKGGDNLVWDNPGGKKSALYAHPDPLLAEAVEALEKFVAQWNACGPNSDFGRYFKNVRDTAVSVLAKVQTAKEQA